MSIATSCSHCQAPYTLNERMLGKTVRCKSCGETFTVEDTAVAPTPRSSTRAGVTPKPRKRQEVEDDWDDREDDDYDRPAAKKGSSMMPILLIGGGIFVFLLLGLCGVGGYLIYRASQDEEPPVAEGPKAPEQPAGERAAPNNPPNNPANNNPPAGGNPGFGGQPPAGNPPPGQGFGGNNPGAQPPDQSGVRRRGPIANIPDALDALKAPDRARRQEAADYLITAPVDKDRQADVARALEPLLEDSNEHVRQAAARALSNWGDKDSVPALVRSLDQGNKTFGSDGQRAIMVALGRLKDERGAAVVASYLPQPFMHEDARRALEAMGPIAEKAVLKYYFDRDGGAAERAKALLLSYGTKNSTIAMQGVEDLKSPDLERRRRVVRWLVSAPVDPDAKPEVARALEPLLADNDVFLRNDAGKALITWGTTDNVPGLLKLLDSTNVTLRHDAIKALGNIKDEKAAVPLTLRLLDGLDRRIAAEALKNLGPAAETPVLTGLTNPDPGVRAEVCDILGAIGTKKSLNQLATAVQIANRRRETEVANKALAAIENIKQRSK